MRLLSSLMAALAAYAVFPMRAALAQEEGLQIVGKPTSGAMGFQTAGGNIGRDVHWLDGMILVIITAIVALVCVLLLIVAVRFNRKRNPTPATFTHNSPLEVAWTVVPIVILVFIGAFSLPVLFEQQEIPEGDININVTGYQWYWNYEYPAQKVSFDSYMIGSPATGGSNRLTPEVETQLKEAGYSKDEWLLAPDNAVVVPVGKSVVMNVTGGDVIHSWTVPAFGVKQDAVPGRVAKLWFKADKEGIYFGQCSQLCGQMHSYMPIAVKVVSQKAYDAWLEKAKQDFAMNDAPDTAPGTASNTVTDTASNTVTDTVRAFEVASAR